MNWFKYKPAESAVIQHGYPPKESPLFAKYKIVHEDPYTWAVYVQTPGSCEWEPALGYPPYSYIKTHIWYSEDAAIEQMKDYDRQLKEIHEMGQRKLNHVITEKIYE
jgi:hypothetical protein